MRHWTDIERSLDGILQILAVIANYEKDGEIRFIEGIQSRGFNEHKIFCVVIKGLKNVNAQFGQNSLTFRAVKQIIDTWKVTK